MPLTEKANVCDWPTVPGGGVPETVGATTRTFSKASASWAYPVLLAWTVGPPGVHIHVQLQIVATLAGTCWPSQVPVSEKLVVWNCLNADATVTPYWA